MLNSWILFGHAGSVAFTSSDHGLVNIASKSEKWSKVSVACRGSATSGCKNKNLIECKLMRKWLYRTLDLLPPSDSFLMSFWSWSLVQSLPQYSRMFILGLTNHWIQHILWFSIASILSSKNGLLWVHKKPRWRQPSCETQVFKTIVHSGFILGWD